MLTGTGGIILSGRHWRLAKRSVRSDAHAAKEESVVLASTTTSRVPAGVASPDSELCSRAHALPMATFQSARQSLWGNGATARGVSPSSSPRTLVVGLTAVGLL
jgi:hypothetical protein